MLEHPSFLFPDRAEQQVAAMPANARGNTATAGATTVNRPFFTAVPKAFLAIVRYERIRGINLFVE